MKIFLRLWFSAAVALWLGSVLSNAAGVFDGWDYRAKLTFSQPLDATVTNFPLLVRLDSIPGFSTAQLRSEWADLRFASADEAEALDFEFDSPTAGSNVWVLIPEIAGTNEYIYVYWGQETNAPAASTGQAVWNNDYLAVWYLGETNATGKLSESSGNGPEGVNSSTLAVDGMIGTARDFNGARYVDLTGLSSTSQSYTFSFWIKTTSATASGYFLDTQSGRLVLALRSGGVGYFDSVAWRDTVGSGINNGQWRHIAFVFDGGNSLADVYIDGALAQSGITYNPRNIGDDVRLGSVYNGTGTAYDGLMDEFRIAETLRSANYIHASWISQASNDVFITYGDAEIYTEGLWIEALEATDISAYGATARGRLLSDGGDAPKITLCWGAEDQGSDDPDDWDHQVALGDTYAPNDEISHWLSLTPGTSVVYRFYATNSTGEAWSETAREFTTRHGWYVAPGGSGTDGKSWATAFTNLPDALNAATNGSDDIFMAQSEYDVAAEIAWTNSGISILGGYEGVGSPGTYDATNWPTVIRRDAAYGSFRVMSITGVTDGRLARVTIANGSTPTSSLKAVGGGLNIRDSILEIVDCVFSNNQSNASGNGYVWGGGVYANNSTVNIIRTLFVKNTAKSTPSTNNNRAHGGGMASENSQVTILDCEFVENDADAQGHYGSRGGAIYIVGGSGLVSNTVMTANRSGPNRTRGRAGAIFINAGTEVIDCTIVSNVVRNAENGYGGGGVYMEGGLLRNSLVADNNADWDGGGIFASGGIIESVTVAGNRITEAGKVAGVFLSGVNPIVSNSIFYANYRDFDARDVSVSETGGTLAYSCTTPERSGAGNTGADAEFMDAANGDYRLRPGSPAIDAAQELDWMTGAVDFDGNPRIRNGVPDMGVFESDPPDEGPFRINFIADQRDGIDGLQVVFSAHVAGAATNGLHFYWDFENSGSFDLDGATLSVVTNVYLPGVYAVRLRVTNDSSDDELLVRTGYIIVTSSSVYVASGGDNTDGLSWATAYQSVQTAIDAAAVSNTIHLAGETFLINAALTWAGHESVSILGGYEGVGTPGNRDPRQWPTTIRRNPAAGNFRIMHIAEVQDGLLDGLILADGYTTDVAAQQPYAPGSGGGMIVLQSDLTIQNCVLTNNQGRTGGNSYMWGGGLFAYESVLTVYDSLFVDNLAYGGGLASANNRSLGGGLGARASAVTIDRCQFIGNDADAGGWHGSWGGGVYMVEGTGLIRNSLIARNRAGPNRPRGLGGGIYVTAGTVLENVTVAANQVWNDQTVTAGGIYAVGGFVSNSIAYLNEDRTLDAISDVYAADLTRFAYTCASDLVDGDNNNITADPMFIDPVAGNYRLDNLSPCVDSGMLKDWMITATDLAGNPRVLWGNPFTADAGSGARVDRGAYEMPPDPGSLIQFR